MRPRRRGEELAEERRIEWDQLQLDLLSLGWDQLDWSELNCGGLD